VKLAHKKPQWLMNTNRQLGYGWEIARARRF